MVHSTWMGPPLSDLSLWVSNGSASIPNTIHLIQSVSVANACSANGRECVCLFVCVNSWKYRRDTSWLLEKWSRAHKWTSTHHHLRSAASFAIESSRWVDSEQIHKTTIKLFFVIKTVDRRLSAVELIGLLYKHNHATHRSMRWYNNSNNTVRLIWNVPLAAHSECHRYSLLFLSQEKTLLLCFLISRIVSFPLFYTHFNQSILFYTLDGRTVLLHGFLYVLFTHR